MSETKLEPRSSLPGRIDVPEVRADLSGGSLAPESPTLNERIEKIRPAALEAELKAIFNGRKNIGVGASGDAVELIKDAMEKVGISTDRTSSTITQADRDAIYDYQKSRGLKADGKIGRQTLSMINDDLVYQGDPALPGGFQPTALREVGYGARDRAGDLTVTTAQQALNRIFDGHKSMGLIKEDGIYSNGTRERVKRYQQMMHYPVTGDIDAQTLNGLQYDLGIKRPNGTYSEGVTQTGAPLVQAPGAQNIAVGEPASERVLQRESAKQLDDLFNSWGRFTARDSQNVLRILANTPDMAGLQADYKAVSGKSLLNSIRTKLDGVDRELGVAYYARGMGMAQQQANANIQEISDYKKLTGI